MKSLRWKILYVAGCEWYSIYKLGLLNKVRTNSVFSKIHRLLKHICIQKKDENICDLYCFWIKNNAILKVWKTKNNKLPFENNCGNCGTKTPLSNIAMLVDLIYQLQINDMITKSFLIANELIP